MEDTAAATAAGAAPTRSSIARAKIGDTGTKPSRSRRGAHSGARSPSTTMAMSATNTTP
jgi:hypothetical protein